MHKFLAAGAAAVVLGAGLSACGGGDDKSSSSGGTSADSKVSTEKGVKGGTLSYLASGDVDYIDPGQTYYSFGYQVQLATNRALYTVKPGETDVSPDLAAAKPEISADNKSITVKIKPGIKYSPPLQDRVITTKDIKYAFERAFSKHVTNGYAGAYFSSLVGAPKAGVGEIKDIAGITTPDDDTIVFKFSEPVAGFVSGALQLPITVPVPESYAKPFDAKTPSTYDQHVVFNGPYMVKNDGSGKLTGRQPGKLIQLVRNPSWDAKTDFRPAYLNGVTIKEGSTDPSVSSRQALENSAITCCDSAHPPPDILKLAVQRYKNQVSRVEGGGGHWIALNTTVKPLDDINFRKALTAVTDRFTYRQVGGGPVTGPIAYGTLPPGIPGFDEAGGLKDQAKGMDWLANERGDADVAKKYMLLAKQDGVPVDANGKYTGPATTIILANTPTQLKYGQVLKAAWAKIGFGVKLRQVPQDTVYTKFCGVPKSKTAICTSVGWVKDYNDPETMFDATFDGDNILQQGNVNWSQLNDPKVNAAIKKGREVPAGPERNKYWAGVNKMVNEQAVVIPLTWDDNIQVNSKDVVAVTDSLGGGINFSATWLKSGQ